MQDPELPKLPLKLLKWFCRPDYHSNIEGDLLELYDRRIKSGQHKQAKWLLYKDVFQLFRPGMIRKFKLFPTFNSSIMFRHNLLISFRSFQRDKSTFAINLIGLSIGLACVLLIFMWVNDELGVDKFHEKDNRLYQVMQNFHRPNGIHTWEATPGPLAEALAEELPEIESAVNVNFSQFRPTGILGEGDNYLEASGIFASEDFFEVFSFDLIHGDPKQVLAEKKDIVLSQELAAKLFPSALDAIGKTLEWSYDLDGRSLKESFQVSGIFNNKGLNSSVQFDAVVQYDCFVKAERWAGEWTNDYTETFLVLKKDVSTIGLNDKITSFLKSKNATREPSTLFMQQFSDRYLHGRYESGAAVGGRIAYVRLFSIVAIFILLIACINFVNLSTAQASRKMKEVGVKKTIGASRGTLIGQFLSESMLLVILALGVALSLVALFLNEFNEITGKQLLLAFDFELLPPLLGILFITSLVAGSYPAFYLSKIRTVSVLKGRLIASTNEFWVRKSLVILQFALELVWGT